MFAPDVTMAWSAAELASIVFAFGEAISVQNSSLLLASKSIPKSKAFYLNPKACEKIYARASVFMIS